MQWLSLTVLPLMQKLSHWALGACLTLLVTGIVLRRARPSAGRFLYVLSYYQGLTMWVFGLVITHILWGWFGVFIGVALLGIGVVPTGMLASALVGEWSTFRDLWILVAITVGPRYLGLIWSALEETPTPPQK